MHTMAPSSMLAAAHAEGSSAAVASEFANVRSTALRWVLILTWNSRLSQKGCPDEGKGRKAKAGRYEVVGRNLKVTSDGTPFALSNKKN